jgi:glutamyl-tRNA reductase
VSALVVGLSHRSAPLDVLDRAALPAPAVERVLAEVAAGAVPYVDEAVVLSTCNRVEVYAEVSRFHGGVEAVRDLLLRHSALHADEVTPHLYVHFEERAVHHAFAVACGLESLVVGEAQILGQVRDALRTAQAASTVGSHLHELFQSALRVGKRAHAETGIDAAGRTLVSEALAAVHAAGGRIPGARAVVVGAGSMAALTVATLRDQEAGPITLVNRGRERAERLAATAGVTLRAWSGLAEALGTADLVVSCTGASGVVLDAATIARARDLVPPSESRAAPLVVVDLALPHDVDPAARDLRGVTLVTLADLAERAATSPRLADDAAVRAIVADEVAAFATHTRATRVAPTVAALRALADDVVAAELARFGQRHPGLDPATQEEVATTVRRVVSKLLHEPTVRVKALADDPDGPRYERVLRELFALDPRTVAAVTEPPPAAALRAGDPSGGGER